LLCGGYRNIMVVGDDDQSIYRFRGAVIENILGFDRKYKDAKIIKLEQNYRSTDVILDAANAIIAKNVGRKGKNLWTERKGGSKITLKLCEEQNTEARYLVDKIQSLVSSNQYSFRDCAILYRTNAQSSVIERTFAKSGVPYRMLGGLRFNDRKEIRDVVAYLQFIVNPADSERMKRIINEPKRGIGATTVDGVLAIAREKEISVFEVMRNADSYVALSRSASKLKAFAEMIASLRKLLASDISLEAFVNQVLDRSGYRQMLIDAGEEEKERVENIEEFVSGVIEYERSNEEPTLIGFLEENALVSDVDKYDETADAVVMMTVHSAKGLEFPVVFLPGMEDGLFPGMQTIMADPSEMEEERRLAYVAITRAKDSVYIIHTKNRMLYGRTSCNPISRFVTEIPARLINEELAYASRTDSRPRTYFSSSGDSYGGYSQRSRTEKSPFAQEPKSSPSRQGLDFKEGDRVYHVTFGPGEILSARPMGADVLYEVVFDKVGTKKLMGTYARLKKLL
ncbi:MAG: ATP-binding domain-containing protein, partial [Clostridia bacterium]|nr:ATP-binding domain-containing protein [Clostridia bacterium]